MTTLDGVPRLSIISRRGLGRAAGNVLRGLVLLVCLLSLFLARWNAPIPVLFALVAVSLVTLYAVDRGTARFGLFVAYFVGFILFALLRTLADNTGIPVHAGYAVHADEWLFGGVLPQHWLQERLYDAGSVSPIAVYCLAIIVSYYLLPHLVALGLWRRRPTEFRRYALAVLIAVYAGLAVSVLVPTAPPWLASTYTDAPHVARIEAVMLRWNPETIGPGPMPGVNPVAAMPSLHFTLTALIVLALWRRPRLRVLSLIYAASMAFSLVFMGEHFVVDVLAGAATATLAWVVASRIVRVPVFARPVVEVTAPSTAPGAAALAATSDTPR